MVLAKFNEFLTNLKFTVDTFPNGIIKFLDITNSVDGADICHKDMHPRQYTHFSSFDPFSHKTGWIKLLFHHEFKICSIKKLLDNHIDIPKSFMSWNGYHIAIRNFLINKLKQKYKSSPLTTIAASDADLPNIWVRLPCLGKYRESLVKSCIYKIQHYLQIPIKFIIFHDTKKLILSVPTRTNFWSHPVVMSFMKLLVQDA